MVTQMGNARIPGQGSAFCEICLELGHSGYGSEGITGHQSAEQHNALK
jgi:hypothetical protein